jgi:hypothetical protein
MAIQSFPTMILLMDTSSWPHVTMQMDFMGDVGWFTSLQLNATGDPVISYIDNSIGALKLATCNYDTCFSPATFKTVDSSGSIEFTSL